jgi:hypothetical protein
MADPLPDRAAFAERFKNTTDLDQRRRFAQDISSAKGREDDRRAAEFEQMQMQNPELMRSVTGRMRESRMDREGRWRADLNQQRFISQQERDARVQGINERRLALQEMQEQRHLNKAERELRDAERIELDTDSFERGEQELREKGYLPGSSQYRDGILNLGARHPYVDSAFRRGVYEGAKIQMDADDIQSELAELTAQNPNASFTIGPDGRPTVRVQAAKPKPTQSAKIDLPRLDKLKAKVAEERAKSNPNAELIGYLDGEISEIDKQRVASKEEPASTTPAPSATTPAPAAAAASTVWRSDAQGNRFEYDAATKKPTGKYIPAK